MRAWLTQNRTVISILLTLIVWSAVIYLISPESLVESVGIGNSYFISFIISLAAGFSFFTGGAAYATVIQFARGGAHPLYLGIAAGVGLFLSDSIFYALLMRGREALSTRFGKWFARTNRLMERLPNFLVYIGVYLFCAFGPIPNDVIMGVLIIGGYKYRKVWPAILAGDVTFMLFLSYLFRQ